MTSRERLHRLFFHQEMDRPAVIVRFWGFRDDPSNAALIRLMTTRADWVEPWDASFLVRTPAMKWERKSDAIGGQGCLLGDASDAERYLALPQPEIGGDVSGFFRLREQVGDRGIVLASLGNNPGGHVAGLFGSETFANMYEKTPDDIRAQTEALIRDCFDDRRGLAVSPTASPFMTGRGMDCYPQYAAMVETVTGWKA
ncbi:MAG: hypothetical protein A3K19_22160 [Lentisphaerae bacterium RIFOXYB12_FULL_65_16]|nr:MAG: hypothetical protein A3K18_21410 [Lentisphaerae bacterium RIFOXYA12_64_32]OGV93566.1 MAG: hypothetical protein A3K19_22160 [Lentisphaerae bacterium RIFOXYB12_FULL_65_16]